MSGNRKELRLKEFSYSEKAAYFITLCCKGGRHLLCEIEADAPDKLRAVGVGVPDDPFSRSTLSRRWRWFGMSTYFSSAAPENCSDISSSLFSTIIPVFVYMRLNPGVLQPVREGASGTPTPTGLSGPGQKRSNERVPAFVSYLKRSTNRSSGMEIWQRGYYDHVVRDYPDYCRIWNYIGNNPYRWFEDKYYT